MGYLKHTSFLRNLGIHVVEAGRSFFSQPSGISRRANTTFMQFHTPLLRMAKSYTYKGSVLKDAKEDIYLGEFYIKYRSVLYNAKKYTHFSDMGMRYFSVRSWYDPEIDFRRYRNIAKNSRSSSPLSTLKNMVYHND